MIKKFFKVFFQTSRTKLFLGVIIYRIILDYIFRNILIVYYTYYDFKDESTSSSRFVSWILLFLFTYIASYTYFNTEKVSNQILFFLFLISIVPFTTMIGYGNFSLIYIVANSTYFFILYAINRFYGKLKSHKIVLRIPGMAGETQLKLICLFSFLIVFFISWRYTEFRFSFGISDAIEWRYAARDFDLPIVFRYLFSWTKCINSMLMVYFIIKKKPLWIAACVAIQILAYGVYGMKFTLFIGIVVFIIAWLPKFDAYKVGYISLVAIIAFGILAALEFATFHS